MQMIPLTYCLISPLFSFLLHCCTCILQLETVKVSLNHVSYVCLDPGDSSVFSVVIRSLDTISSKGLRLHAFVCHPQTVSHITSTYFHVCTCVSLSVCFKFCITLKKLLFPPLFSCNVIWLSQAITFNRSARELFDFMARMMRAKKKMAGQEASQTVATQPADTLVTPQQVNPGD